MIAPSSQRSPTDNRLCDEFLFRSPDADTDGRWPIINVNPQVGVQVGEQCLTQVQVLGPHRDQPHLNGTQPERQFPFAAQRLLDGGESRCSTLASDEWITASGRSSPFTRMPNRAGFTRSSCEWNVETPSGVKNV